MKYLTKYKYLLAIGTFYILIAFEFFYMASPFAAYFYSVYKPGLEFLDKYSALAWLTGFFMPHLVADTKSVILDLIPALGVLFMVIGLLVFLLSASMIYYAKLFKKSAVTGGFYKYVRHPQYTAFILFSFGLLLLWPRYLNLIIFIIMLFVYYILALKEEQECSVKFGKEYINYRKKTFMFFPLPGRPFNAPDEIIIPKWYRVILISISSVIISLTIAFGVKALTLRQLYSWHQDGISWVSIYKKSNEEFSYLSKMVRSDTRYRQMITYAKKNKLSIINYVLPSEMYISELPMEKPDSSVCHIRSADFDPYQEKVIVTEGMFRKGDKQRSNIGKLLKTRRLVPMLEIWIDKRSGDIVKSIVPKESKRYENIPEPIF